MKPSSSFLLLLSFLIPFVKSPALADGVPIMELAEWQDKLALEEWRVLLGNRTEGRIGLFMANPRSTELASHPASLVECGIESKTIVRSNFPNPKVPRELTVSSPESRSMAPAFDRIISAEPNVVSARILIQNPRWVRLLTTETTSFVHSSAIWSNPNLRAALITCIQKVNNQVVVGAVLTADVVVAFYDRRGPLKTLKALQREVDTPGSFFFGALLTAKGTASVAQATVARQRAICTNLDIFFRMSNGAVGEETC